MDQEEGPILDLGLTQLKYVGPYLSERFRTHSFWPPNDHRRRRLHPIRSLRDLVNFVVSRRGPHAKGNLTEWLRVITENARAGDCVTTVNEPHACPFYRVRPQNLFGHTMIINFLRAYVPRSHQSKVPARQAHPTRMTYQRNCCPDGPHRNAVVQPPRTLQWAL